jgi:fatty acyl-CoA reductase
MPNAYFLTKRMAEVHLASLHSAVFPLCVVRPSLIGCTAQSPHPGYFGNNAGPTAIALAFALGLVTFTSHKVSAGWEF